MDLNEFVGITPHGPPSVNKPALSIEHSQVTQA